MIDEFAIPLISRSEGRAKRESEGVRDHERAEDLAEQVFALVQGSHDEDGRVLDCETPLLRTSGGNTIVIEQSSSQGKLWGYRVLLADSEDRHFYAVFGGGRDRIYYDPGNGWLYPETKDHEHDNEILELLEQALGAVSPIETEA